MIALSKLPSLFILSHPPPFNASRGWLPCFTTLQSLLPFPGDLLHFQQHHQHVTGKENKKHWGRISTANWTCFPLPLFFSTIVQKCPSHAALSALCSLSTWELGRLGQPGGDLVSENLANALDQDFWLEKQQQQRLQCPGVNSGRTLPPRTEPAACNPGLQVKASKRTTSAECLWHLYDGKGWEALGKLWARLQISALNWRQLLLLGAILGLQQSRLYEHPPHHAPALLFTAVCSSEKHLHLSHLLRV